MQSAMQAANCLLSPPNLKVLDSTVTDPTRRHLFLQNAFFESTTFPEKHRFGSSSWHWVGRISKNQQGGPEIGLINAPINGLING